jgi:predicted RNA polymerase sigma factor
LAERYHFEDKCSIHIARGGVFRLLHRSDEATADFKKAFELLDKNDKVGE